MACTVAFLLVVALIGKLSSECQAPLAMVHEPVAHANAPFSDSSSDFSSPEALGRIWMRLC